MLLYGFKQWMLKQWMLKQWMFSGLGSFGWPVRDRVLKLK